MLLVLRAVASDTTDGGGQGFAFHARLADPAMYEEGGGSYAETFELATGTYTFVFIPNGDSPRTLSIAMEGRPAGPEPPFSFREDFELEGTSHKTPISEYYTWDYLGQKEFSLDRGQEIDVSIDPHGNVLGPVSVMIKLV